MRKKLCVAVIAAAVMLTGCTSAPDLSNVHRDMEAEYIAGILLKYDANNEDMLDYDRSLLKPTPTPVPTRKPAAEPTPSAAQNTSGAAGGTDTQTVNYVTADELLSGDSIRLKLQTYELQNSYGSSYATIEAHDGKKLLVMKFRVKNSSGSSQKVNLMKKDLSYSLEADGSAIGSPLMTILENDLQYLDTRLAAGKSMEAVLIFEVDASRKLEDASLNITDGSRTAQLPLK